MISVVGQFLDTAVVTAGVRALREMAQDFRDIGMVEAADLCDEKAVSLTRAHVEGLRV